MAVPSESYWVAVATVLPVVGLALVVEARALSSRWNEELPWWVKATQCLIWAGVLTGAAFVESPALRALRGQHVWSGWPQVAESVISSAFGVLVLAPALDYFVRALSPLIARGLLGPDLVRTWRSRCDVRRLRRQSARLAVRQAAGQARAEATLREAERMLSGAEAAGAPADVVASARLARDAATAMVTDHHQVSQEVMDLTRGAEVLDEMQQRRERDQKSHVKGLTTALDQRDPP